MPKRQSNLYPRSSSQQPDSSQPGRIQLVSSASNSFPNKLTASARKHQTKKRQCNISFHRDTDLIGQSTCSKEEFKINNQITRQSNVTCRSTVSKSGSTKEDVNRLSQKKIFDTSLVSASLEFSASSVGIQDRHGDGRGGGKRHILQAVENVEENGEDEDFHNLHQDGSSAKILRKLKSQHWSLGGHYSTEKKVPDHVNLKRKHASTTNIQDVTSKERRSSDDHPDNSFITIATNEGSMHLSELSFDSVDTVERMDQWKSEREKLYSKSAHQVQEIFICSPKPISPEMYSALPYYRGNQAKQFKYSEEESSFQSSHMWKRQRLGHQGKTLHDSGAFERDDRSTSLGGRLEVRNRYHADKENLRSTVSQKMSPEKNIPSEDESRFSFSRASQDVFKDELILENLAARHSMFSSSKRGLKTLVSDENDTQGEMQLEKRLYSNDDLHANDRYNQKSGITSPDVFVNTRTKEHTSMSSLLPRSSIKHADASKGDKIYHSYVYEIAEEDPGKSLYAQYQEDLESQTKSMPIAYNGSSRNSDSFLPLSSSQGLSASQDNVQMLLMSNTTAPVISDTTAPVISDQLSSEPPQSAIFPTQSGYYKSKHGSDSGFDFISDSKTKATTHDVLTSHDSDTSIWRSIRYVAKELEHDKSYASYRQKEDSQNETKVKSTDAKTKSAKNHHSSSISSSALPSSTTCRTSPQGKGSTFSNFKLNSSSSRQISSTSHPNLSNMSSTRKFTNRNISADQSGGWASSNVEDDFQFIARQGHSSSNVLEHQRSRSASIGKTSPLRYTSDVDTGSRVQRSQGQREYLKPSPPNVTHKTLSQSAMVPEGYLGQGSTVRHKQSSVSSKRLPEAESRASDEAAASQMHGSKTLLQSSYRNFGNTSDIQHNTSQYPNTSAVSQGKSMQKDFDTSLKYNDLLVINTSGNSSGTFLLEDLQSTVSDVSARQPTYKTNNQPYVAKTRSEHHGLRSMTAADSHRLSSVHSGVTTQRNGIKQVVHTRKAVQQNQQLRKPVQSSQMRANKGLKHLSQKMHQQKLSPERRTAQDVNLSNSSLSSLSPNGKSPRRTTSILWAFKLLDLLHSAPLDKQEELVTKAYWFRRWLVNVRILGAAKREEQDNWNRAVALHNLHLLQKTFTGWQTIIRVNQEAARQMWHQHTLEKGLRSLQWAVSQTKILQDMMEERRHMRDLAIHFNKWKNVTAYRRQRFQLLDTIARKYTLAKTFTQWKKQHAVEQRKNIAVLHFKVQLLSSAFHQWQEITARSRVKGCQEEMASVHFEVRITKVYWESMKTMYVKTQQAKQHYRHHCLVQVFRAWQQGCLVAKGEHLRDNCQAKEARRRALMRTHLTMWREKLRVLKARKRLDQVKLRYAWEIWQLRYQRQKLHRLILASQERRDTKRRALHRWMVYVHEWKERRKKAETILGRVLLRRRMQRWKEGIVRQKNQRFV
ncbi:uncharacterized protein [Amphiura filiformis]|uniref:uncharacterized protein n=1 Tax=Amphiura filiformis TaxID=82378 RepID=UPI003B228D57